MTLTRTSSDNSRISALSLLPSGSISVAMSNGADEKFSLWLVRWLLNPSFYASSLQWKIPNAEDDTCTS